MLSIKHISFSNTHFLQFSFSSQYGSWKKRFRNCAPSAHWHCNFQGSTGNPAWIGSDPFCYSWAQGVGGGEAEGESALTARNGPQSPLPSAGWQDGRGGIAGISRSPASHPGGYEGAWGAGFIRGERQLRVPSRERRCAAVGARRWFPGEGWPPPCKVQSHRALQTPPGPGVHHGCWKGQPTFEGLEIQGASRALCTHRRGAASRALESIHTLRARRQRGTLSIHTQAAFNPRDPQPRREGGHPKACWGPGQSPAQIQGQHQAFFLLAHRSLEDH